MNKSKYKIPKCPECKKTITEVYENTYEKYFFNKKTGKYEEFAMGGELEIKCSICGADISDFFEEGVCNYQAIKIKKEK